MSVGVCAAVILCVPKNEWRFEGALPNFRSLSEHTCVPPWSELESTLKYWHEGMWQAGIVSKAPGLTLARSEMRSTAQISGGEIVVELLLTSLEGDTQVKRTTRTLYLTQTVRGLW